MWFRYQLHNRRYLDPLFNNSIAITSSEVQPQMKQNQLNERLMGILGVARFKFDNYLNRLYFQFLSALRSYFVQLTVVWGHAIYLSIVCGGV